jgi:hypothetical protein
VVMVMPATRKRGFVVFSAVTNSSQPACFAALDTREKSLVEPPFLVVAVTDGFGCGSHVGWR